MNIQLRIAILWIVIVLCYFIHGYYHLAELFFGIDIKLPDTTAKVPLAAHLFSVFIEIIPLTIAVTSLFIFRKWFVTTTWIFAIVLGLLNLVHLVQTLLKEPGEIRQIALLTFIVVVNVLLVKDLNFNRKVLPPVS